MRFTNLPSRTSLTLLSWAACVCVSACADTLLFSSAAVWYCAGMRVCERYQTSVVVSDAWPVFFFLKAHSEPCTADYCEGRSAFRDKIKMFELRLSSVKSTLFFKLPSQCIDSSFRNIESLRMSFYSLWNPLLCYFLPFSIHASLLPSCPSDWGQRSIFQLSSHSFRNFTTWAFPLSSLKKAINLICFNPDSSKLAFTKPWCTAFFSCLKRLFKHLPQIYLLADWYTLYIGVDRGGNRGYLSLFMGLEPSIAATWANKIMEKKPHKKRKQTYVEFNKTQWK